MNRLLSLKLKCLFSIGNNGFHIENFSHVFQMSEDKNKKLQKKNYVHLFQEGKLFAYTRGLPSCMLHLCIV